MDASDFPGPSNGSDFFEVVARQRAHRAFESDEIPEASIERILGAAVMAPSAENRQPWEFVVVREVRMREAIGSLTERVWDGGAKAYSESRLSPAFLADVDAGARGGISGAPVIVVVCSDMSRCSPQSLGSSIFPAVQNLLLATTALGLGSALTTLTTVLGRELGELLELPEDVTPVAVVPIGVPARALGPPRRESFVTHTHREHFGLRW